MRAERFIPPLNFTAVISTLCRILRIIGLVFVPPLAVALISFDLQHALMFAIAGAAPFFLSFSAYRVREAKLGGTEALIVTAASYLILGLAGAVAFLPESSFLNGFFESMSGFTTTGLSVMQVDRLPYSLLFFRSYSQWAGGFGIIVLSLLILTGPGRNAFQLYLSEFGERNLEGSVRLMAREVGFIYLVITTTGYLAYAAAGMGWSNALLNILSTVSTGGFSGHADSFGYYKSPAVQIVAIPFMIMGALSFTTFLRTVNRDSGALLRDRQLQLLLALILFYFGLGLAFRASRSVGPLALLFRAASEVTTTGFSIAGYTGPTQDLRLLDLLLMVTGGSSGSTAGGIKLFRLILMVKTIRFWILSVLFPEEVRLPIRVGDQIIHERELRMAFAFVGVFALLLSFTAVTLALAGFAPVEALYEAASALGTVGTSSGITSPALAPELKLLLVVNMWAGRLEILPLLLLFYPRLWIERRRSP